MEMEQQVMAPKERRYVDGEILSLLQDDCRLSYAKIAAKIGISVGAAFRHVKQLEKKGFIKKYSAVLDPTRLGYNLTTIILLQTEGGSNEEIEKELSNSPNVLGLYDITGDYDIAIIGKFKNRDFLNSFIKKLLSKPTVRRTATNVALKVMKEEFKVKF